MRVLDRSFYRRDTVAVARDLLGKRLVRRVGRRQFSGIITETEAYKGRDDPASHSYGRMTERNRVMFGEVGMAYVYFTYGMHHCFNVVARGRGAAAGAVLVRAMRPERGLEWMMESRGTADAANVSNGPAKLAQALSITKEQYGADLTRDPSLHITEGVRRGRITASPRVGIRKATEKLWNFRIR